MFENCMKMGFGGFCSICNDGFYLDINGQCKRLPEGCNRALPSGFCSQCNNGYTLTPQGSCFVGVDNCLNANGNICLQCNSGYYVN